MAPGGGRQNNALITPVTGLGRMRTHGKTKTKGYDTLLAAGRGRGRETGL